ncbi:MAG: DMT family transporter [Acidimicrobiales bacterium]
MRIGPVAQAMTLLVIAMALIPLMDAFAKLLSTDHAIAPASVATGRFVVQSAILFGVFTALLLTRHRRRPSMRPTVTWVHLTRGALHGTATLLFFVAITYMPLADAIAVFFVEPMILLALSALFLGETVGWPRRIAAVVAFGGAILVIQPSYELFGAVSLLPLLTAGLFATYLLFTRKYGTSEHPLTMQLWSGLGGIAVGSVFIVVGELIGASDYQLTIPSSQDAIVLLAGVGVVSTVSHLMIVVAFTMAPASVLAPFNYLEIVTATLFGHLVFDEFPGALQRVGIIVIVATGLFIFYRERALELEAHRPAVSP